MEKWILDQTSIFAQVDAFVQRCKDLLEVVFCQRAYFVKTINFFAFFRVRSGTLLCLAVSFVFFLKVCDGQMHFARKKSRDKVELPIFAGVKGPEIVRGLVEIEATFEKNLQMLKNFKHIILDVKVIFFSLL